MITPYLVVYIAVSVVLLGIGTTVLLRNPKARLNQLFMVLVGGLVAWLFSNYFSNDLSLSLPWAVTANHLVLFFAAIDVFVVLYFVAIISKSQRIDAYAFPLFYVHVVAALATLSPLIVRNIERQDKVYAIVFGPLAPVYFGLMFIDVALIFYALWHGVHTSRGQDKARSAIILASLGTWIGINLVTNLVLPSLFGVFALTNIGPISSVILAFGLGYTIIRYKLFNIQLIIARLIGYGLAVLALGLLYALITFFLLGHLLLADTHLSEMTIFLFTATAVVTAFSFNIIKRFFDKVSRHIFYQDRYDPQTFLDSFNRTIVSTINVNVLLESSAEAIAHVFKASFCTFAIRHDGKQSFELIGESKTSLGPHFVKLIPEEVLLDQKPLVTDSLNQNSPLQHTLYKNDVAVICSLKAQNKSPIIGCLILGPKRSGNLYTDGDVKLIQIVASELGLALQNALRFEEIENFNATLQQKVDEATRRLRRTNDKLRLLDETKDDFISMASHQLRTPLTSVKGYVSMVLDGDAGKISPLQRKLLNQSFISSQRMVYLISDLLNVSRLRTGKFVIEPTSCNLAAVVQEEVEQLVETARGRDLTLTYNRPEHFPDIVLDETKTRQVIMNFIDNAIYYTPAGGHIVIRLEEKSESVELTVNDDGIGVPRAEQHHLFSKFYRAPNAKRARPDGTGLGLFMAKKIIIAQGGALIFHSKEGQGSIFGFTLPKTNKMQSLEAPSPVSET